MAQPAEAPKGGLQLGAALPKDRADRPAKGSERSAPDADPLHRFLNYRCEGRPAPPFI
jgi:hypothetical protein